jgi:8-oxo-dGTP pyrophosphatase MutT (NUDIX family)
VLLVRGNEPWELLMVQRPGGADFAPGAWVFPGGAVQESDRVMEDELRAAAVRELFEEAGILLARDALDADCVALSRLLGDGAAFFEALRGLSLVPAFDELVMFARWVTPAQVRRRFDARFYVARFPEGQSVRPQEGEVTAWRWISPAEALTTGDITLVYATRAVLESVADAPDAETLLARARALGEIPIVEPRIVQTETGWQIVRD